MMKLSNYVSGQWVEGKGEGAALVDPVNGEVLAHAGSEGIDLKAGLAYSRNVGGTALRALSYAARAAFLGKAAEVLLANRDKYYQLALANSGNTKADAAIGNLHYFSAIGKGLGETRFMTEPGMDRLGKDKNFQSVHILTPLKGVAVHINAFNFPSWGLWEKAAV
jgi:3,4-dehydroadipyl-CoA semialdehyde dehydrogenase